MSDIKNNQGTTLIEVLISIILVAITTLGGIALYFNATELQSIVFHKKMAIELANSKMEECRRTDCITGVPEPISIGGLEFPTGREVSIIDPELNESAAQFDINYEKKMVKVEWNATNSTNRKFDVDFTTWVPKDFP